MLCVSRTGLTSTRSSARKRPVSATSSISMCASRYSSAPRARGCPQQAQSPGRRHRGRTRRADRLPPEDERQGPTGDPGEAGAVDVAHRKEVNTRGEDEVFLAPVQAANARPEPRSSGTPISCKARVRSIWVRSLAASVCRDGSLRRLDDAHNILIIFDFRLLQCLPTLLPQHDIERNGRK